MVASEKALKSSTTTTLSPAAAAKDRLLLLALALMTLLLLRGRMVEDEEEAWRKAGRAMRCSNMVVVMVVERTGTRVRAVRNELELSLWEFVGSVGVRARGGGEVDYSA